MTTTNDSIQNRVSMETIVSLCKRRGFIFPSSEIYGGLANTWDYGPLGAELKRNVKDAWWKAMVHNRDDVVGLDASILMHPETWKASGHAENFTDLLVDDKETKKRFRYDHMTEEEKALIGTRYTEPRAFNLMLKTRLGALEDSSSDVFLRPETAQGIFVNFKNVVDATSRKLPFGIAQIGKSFRNEITAGNFTFRQREFEQMEIEYFVNPEDGDKCYEEWIETRFNWYLNLGVKKENLRLRKHAEDELAHYAKGCTDVEYKFPFGWSELEGIAHRADYDLKQHAKFSNKDLQYQDQVNNTKFYPHVIEPSGGVDRSLLAFLIDAYDEEMVEDKPRVVLRFSRELAPIKAAVLPLLRNKPEIVALAHRIKGDLSKSFVCAYNDTAAIGKLYRRQDEVGTLYCITVDPESLEDGKVTVRDRDTMAQERVDLGQLKNYLTGRLLN